MPVHPPSSCRPYRIAAGSQQDISTRYCHNPWLSDSLLCLILHAFHAS
jgi:hypothetical protein